MGTHCSCCHPVCHPYCFIVILIVSLTKLHLNVSHCFLLIVFLLDLSSHDWMFGTLNQVQNAFG